jgi:Flp pilus assembly protein TadG
MFRRFRKDRSGIAAVEFAFIAPIIVAVIAMGWNVWQAEAALEQARTAVRAGAEYYTAGGTTDATAQTVALNAWAAAPANARVTAARACYCNGTIIDCSIPCTPGQQRTVYVTLTASGTGQGVFASRLLSQQEIIRVQ